MNASSAILSPSGGSGSGLRGGSGGFRPFPDHRVPVPGPSPHRGRRAQPPPGFPLPNAGDSMTMDRSRAPVHPFHFSGHPPPPHQGSAMDSFRRGESNNFSQPPPNFGKKY